MNATPAPSPDVGEPPERPLREDAAGWDIRRHGTVVSTQDLAAALPPWSAVVAQAQTAGVGQWSRPFVSNPGGLFLTAVLPYDGDAARGRGFALVVGLSIVMRFRRHGVGLLRLRWPNDLMIGGRKVGGILVAQGGPGTVLVGLGLNVLNEPWLQDDALGASACRLADFAGEGLIGLDFLERVILAAIRDAHEGFGRAGLRGHVEALNLNWGPATRVRLELVDGAGGDPWVTGRFLGIQPDGDLVVEDAAGRRLVVPAHRVKRLVECPCEGE